jgi:hypothetical protein
MADEKEHKSAAEEKRSYFRVEDIISVVANPVHIDKEKAEEFRQSVVSSKAFSLMDVQGQPGPDLEESIAESLDSMKLHGMMTEIKTKLDFIINHLMLDREGFIKSEKKFVNISASGIRFTVERPVKVNDIMEIKLLLPTYPPVAVFAYGEVKRVKELDKNKYEVALEYLNMSESVRNEIVQYTLLHQREIIRKKKESGANE